MGWSGGMLHFTSGVSCRPLRFQHMQFSTSDLRAGVGRQAREVAENVASEEVFCIIWICGWLSQGALDSRFGR